MRGWMGVTVFVSVAGDTTTTLDLSEAKGKTSVL